MVARNPVNRGMAIGALQLCAWNWLYGTTRDRTALATFHLQQRVVQTEKKEASCWYRFRSLCARGAPPLVSTR